MSGAAMWGLLAAVLSGCSISQGEAHPFIKCAPTIGPPADWTMKHNFTPSGLYDLHAKIVEIQGICQFNITWSIQPDGSIQFLTATRICISEHGHPICVTCDYTERFQTQTLGHHKWQFYYVGYPVQENTIYDIYASNLPSANANEDHATIHITHISPDCEDELLKYSTSCREKGSMWDPNITVCNMESEIEVNFTASSFSIKYKMRLCESDECDDPTVHTIFTTKGNYTRISVRIPMTGQSSKHFTELIPYFPKCNNDCRRYSKYQQLCSEKPTMEVIKDSVGIIVGTLTALFMVLCVVAALLYFNRRHGTVRMWSGFHPSVQQIPAKILVVYSREVCFQHTVLPFAEFLHECCHSDVIIDVWQKRRIAEIGPVQWLAVQKEIADKIIFVSSSHASPQCDSACKSVIESQNGNSECMFMLAFNLFCSDWKKQSSLHKYMVVSFSETNSAKDLPSALNICPKYFLMKDIDSFYRELYHSQSMTSAEGTAFKCSWQSKITSKFQV